MSLPNETVRGEERAAGTLGPRDERVADVLTGTLSYARDREYAGWRSDRRPRSRLLAALPVGTLLGRAPLDLRPLLAGDRRRGVESAALFAMANQTAGWLHRTDPAAVEPSDDADYRTEAERLVEWLRANRRAGPDDLDEGAGRSDDPGDRARGIAATSVAVRALVRGVYLDVDNAEVARSAAPALLDAVEAPDAVAADAAALGARLLLDLYDHFGESWLLDRAEGLLDGVASWQGSRGGWRSPAAAADAPSSNRRTGAVIGALQRHEVVADGDRYGDVLADALHYYQRTLFEAHGAPNFDEERTYPRAADAAARGVLVFAREGDYRFADRILDWTLANLYAGDGRFYPRKHRFHTERRVRMRQAAWMAHALAEYLRRRYIDAAGARTG